MSPYCNYRLFSSQLAFEHNYFYVIFNILLVVYVALIRIFFAIQRLISLISPYCYCLGRWNPFFSRCKFRLKCKKMGLLRIDLEWIWKSTTLRDILIFNRISHWITEMIKLFLVSLRICVLMNLRASGNYVITLMGF